MLFRTKCFPPTARRKYQFSEKLISDGPWDKLGVVLYPPTLRYKVIQLQNSEAEIISIDFSTVVQNIRITVFSYVLFLIFLSFSHLTYFIICILVVKFSAHVKCLAFPTTVHMHLEHMEQCDPWDGVYLPRCVFFPPKVSA